MGAHAFFLQLQGGESDLIAVLERGEVETAPLPENEKALLRFVALNTQHAYKTTRADVDAVRRAGWSDEQIAEAVYVSALFAMFNRVADAFGLVNPNYRELAAAGGQPPPPAERHRPG